MLAVFCSGTSVLSAQERRPVDARHPMWLIHVDVWNQADPQKIINLIPDDIKPYVCLNLSLSCSYDKEKDVYMRPQDGVRTFRSWATVCQANNMWFSCQPASGGHTHIKDDDLETFEYFFKRYPNFLGWNFAEQFWGFDEPGDKSSSSQLARLELFSKLIPMSHRYGGFLTISFCGNIWSHGLNPVGMMKRNAALLQACRDYPEAILWLFKYTTSSCFYNNESVTLSPFISGLAKNYGVRYDNCGWNGAIDDILGKDHGRKYPVAAGIGTVMEQTCVNGGAVWDGPELIWTEDFQNLSNTVVDGYTRRNWGRFPGFDNAWIDMFRKIIDGTMYIPTRKEVVEKTKIVVVNDMTSGNDEDKYASWGSLYDGLYKQDDPFNKDNGQWMNNYWYLKKTGRYGTIPVAVEMYDDIAKTIPVVVKKSERTKRWPSEARKVEEYNKMYPETSTGDLFVARHKNQLVVYTPYTYLNSKTTASATVPLKYNTCGSLNLTLGQLGSGVVREYADRIKFYLNNYRTDVKTNVLDKIVVEGAVSQPSYKMTRRGKATATASEQWDQATGTYTLEVKHNGPVDVEIACAGEATDRDTDVLPDAALTADMPVQPGNYSGELIIEAEDMDFNSIKDCVVLPYYNRPDVRGFIGNGFIETGTNRAASLRHTTNKLAAGTYDVTIRYSSPVREGQLKATIGGREHTLSCEKTQTNQWRKVTFTATLSGGSNRLTITNTGGTDMMIDQIIYAPQGMPAEKYLVTIRDVEHGKVTANTAVAAEGEKVMLTVEPDNGYVLAGWEIVHGNVAIGDDLTFVMPDDNVTLRPLFVDATSVYKLDFTTVGTGAMPEGWRTVQGGDEVHEYPNTYGQGARTFVGFAGYQGKALYWREKYAEYGRQEAYPLTLSPGTYKLSYAVAAWKGQPSYRVSVIDASSGKAVAASKVHAAAPDATGSNTADVSGAVCNELEVEIKQEGNYIISFRNSADGFSEYLLLECRLSKDDQNSIGSVVGNEGDEVTAIYGIDGVKRSGLQKGLNIVILRSGKSKKIICR
ncbi:glycosyl hydrolase family 98 [Prevotella sp. PMUR]|uniref:Glycosyl hydrolase family 98 n=2 Tax=Xylanibacter muris TaxID=2736290 RepID=A0ABX2AMB1_9BACT|nr:glycosyl hydrolase family 98 [Xylanibacter muris]